MAPALARARPPAAALRRPSLTARAPKNAMWRTRYRKARAWALHAAGTAPPPRVFADALSDIKGSYTLGHPIGKGAYGTVFRGERLEDGLPVAIKVVPKSRLTDATLLGDARREGEIMRLASHPSIVQLLDLAEDDHNLYYVQELCEGGELFDRIVREGTLTEADAARVFEAAVRAIDFLHQLGVAHRDVKPENWLLGGAEGEPLADRLRLADFGLACYALPGTRLTDLVGSAPYVAPEVVLRSYDARADVWSLGVVLYVILSGLPAFWGANDGDIFDAILSPGDVDLSTPPWPNVSADARDLVAKLLTRDPDARLTAADALRHPWLRANGASDAPLDPVVSRRLARFAGMSKLRKAALITVAGGLTATESAAMRALFDSIDADGNGRITASELRSALDSMAPDSALVAASGALEAAVAAVSGSGAGGGGLEFPQFVAAAHSVAALTRESQLATAFAAWDADASGGLTLEEVRGALAGTGLTDDGDLAAAFAAADASGDGEIDLCEFMALARAALEARPADDACRRVAADAVRLRAEAAADEVVAKSA